MLLGWDQLGFWRLKIELGTIEAIPLIGAQLKDALTGGGALGTISVEHLYAIHSYIVPISAVGLAVVHLGSLLVQEREVQAEALMAFAQTEVGEGKGEVQASADAL